MKKMRKYISIECSFFILMSVLLIGCAGAGSRPPSTLAGLRGGMTMDSAVRILGPPTTLVELRSARQSEAYYDLTYVNTIIAPGVVELYFRPGLAEIRLNTEVYKDFSDARSGRSD